MRKKIFNALNKTYGILMTVSFFSGLLPVIPFLLAILVGGELGETICVFLHKQYYPWVIMIGSVAIVVGMIAMYVGKLEALSVKNVSTNNDMDNKQ